VLRRRILPIIAALALAGCGAGLERGLAATLNHRGDVGGRASIGMLRGENGWLTQMVLMGESSGFGAAGAGVAWRLPEGVTPRFELAGGVATRSASIGGDCVVDEEGNQTCTDGLGPYGELSVGMDVPLAEGAPVLTFGVTGTGYLNSDDFESRLELVVGVAWK
jgi:hypothetical protein